jgi:hypothetical protein
MIKAFRDQPNLAHVRAWKSQWSATRPAGHPPVDAPAPPGPQLAPAASRAKPAGERHPNGRPPAGGGRARGR